MVDLLLHGSIIFGWNSLVLIIAPVPAKTSGLIFILATSLSGVILFIYGTIRDFVSYGISRVVIFGSLTLIYILMALSPYWPSLLFALTIHLSAGFGLFIGSLQMTILFPTNTMLLMAIASAMASLSSMWPTVWKWLIDEQLMTFSTIMWGWSLLAFGSLVLGIFMLPWHNLSIDENYPTLHKSNVQLVTIGDQFPSLQTKMKQSLQYLKNPMFLIQLTHYPIVHFAGDYFCVVVSNNLFYLNVFQ